MKRRPTFIISTIDVRPLLNQKFHHVQIIIDACLKQARISVIRLIKTDLYIKPRFTQIVV